ncbi:MAG: 4-hydroxythreonine-4-phosphate dehydrogenase PdxA, partial [Candidatus Omnitrophota bacterium]
MRISRTNKPQIFITMGDPAGIGPEVIMKSMASPEIRGLAIFAIIGDKGVMEEAARAFFPEDLVFHEYGPGEGAITLNEDKVNILDPGPALAETRPGEPTEEGARKTLECIAVAAGIMKDGENKAPKAMVTAPVNKEAIAGVHEGFIGHTEYLQEASSSKLVTMVMLGDNLCVAPVTRHIPLSEVSSALKPGLLEDTLMQVVANRGQLSESEPVRIGVCGLNPHCGENGKIGTEEIEIIRPAVEKAKKTYEHIEGPVSADVLFYKALKKKVDVVISMYHDQGLAPFKMVDFDSGINMTL